MEALSIGCRNNHWSQCFKSLWSVFISAVSYDDCRYIFSHFFIFGFGFLVLNINTYVFFLLLQSSEWRDAILAANSACILSILSTVFSNFRSIFFLPSVFIPLFNSVSSKCFCLESTNFCSACRWCNFSIRFSKCDNSFCKDSNSSSLKSASWANFQSPLTFGSLQNWKITFT